MTEQRRFVCIGCPIGCSLVLDHVGREVIEVHGNECDRGAKYARQEFTDPRRSFSTTVALAGASIPRLPVKVTAPVPKERVLEAARAVHALRAVAPVARGDVLLRGLLGLPGVDVVACRSVRRR